MISIKHKSSNAFSLVEISIIILIIGILIAGISKGMDLYQETRINMAKKITLNSRVGRIPNLELWFEATLQNSFAIGTTSYSNIKTPNDQTQIGRWNDINPNITINSRNNASQSTLTNQPTYLQNGINRLPSLSFDGSNDHLFYDGSFLIKSDYTIFVVEQRTSGASDNFFLAGNSLTSDKNLVLGYYMSTITQSHFGGLENRIDKTIPAYSQPITRLHSFLFSKNFGKLNYTNKGMKLFNTSQTNPISDYSGSSIGNAYNLYYFKGLIGEIIIYSRALSDLERQDIENYLSQKWNIGS